MTQKTLLDEFAMAALTGLCASMDLDGKYVNVAELAYDKAAEMMQERKKYEFNFFFKKKYIGCLPNY